MKLTQIRMAGQATGAAITLGGLSSELNVVFGPPGAGKSAVAQLAAHLLYGKIDGPQRRSVDRVTPLAEGSVDIDSGKGGFVLRRHRDGSAHGRLTIASADGAPVDSRTIRTLLGDLSPGLLAELCAVDFADAPQAKLLLEGDFARQFTHSLSCPHADEATPRRARTVIGGSPATVNRGHIDDLVRRRDQVVEQIEAAWAAQRRDGQAIQRELAQIESAMDSHRNQAAELASQVHAVEVRLADLTARLRYSTIESIAAAAPEGNDFELQAAVEELDGEINRCRHMLGDLQSREAGVRRELAEAQPDGTADSVDSLAQQRVTIGVFERLLDDLDAEVAGLARSNEPGRAVAADAHARALPVAQMLRQQLYALCGQVTEQERAARRWQARAELRQLSRAQVDLSEQLEHLLERRLSLVHQMQLANRAAAPPQAPVARHCQCAGHDAFMRTIEGGLTRMPGGRYADDARREQREIEAKRQELRDLTEANAREMTSLQERWDQLQLERAAAGRAPLEERRAQLERLEAEINRALVTSEEVARPAGATRNGGLWKASDALAQLTNGQLTQIRLSREGRAATIVDREGRLLVLEDLTPQQHDQLYVALVLALCSSLSARGVDVPLVLDEPFLRQDAAGAAAMAGVIAEFAREGRQTLVFTHHREALRQFQTLGTTMFDLDALRLGHAPPTVEPAAGAAASTVRIVRELAAPKLRLAGVRVAPAAEKVGEKPTYYLTVDASLADFPVLGNDTAVVFSSLGIRTVEDLLATDAADVARRLAHPAVNADSVRLWQQHTSLMCFVPGVSLADAQVLAACEVTSPEALFSIDVRLLAEAVGRFLTTERGRRFASSRDRFGRDRLAQLQKHARRQRDRWQLLSPRYAWVERTVDRGPVKPVARSRPARKSPPVAAPRRIARKLNPRPLRFFLDRSRPAGESPSIGRVMAERLGRAGVRTVADLLNANPESLAEELGGPRVSPAAVARWQSEARLTCRVPELRSQGAQILVACGLTEPEQIAGSSAAELTAKVRTYCRSSAGQRLLRGRPAPNSTRVAAWIRHAGNTRPLEAA